MHCQDLAETFVKNRGAAPATSATSPGPATSATSPGPATSATSMAKASCVSGDSRVDSQHRPVRTGDVLQALEAQRQDLRSRYADDRRADAAGQRQREHPKAVEWANRARTGGWSDGSGQAYGFGNPRVVMADGSGVAAIRIGRTDCVGNAAVAATAANNMMVERTQQQLSQQQILVSTLKQQRELEAPTAGSGSHVAQCEDGSGFGDGFAALPSHESDTGHTSEMIASLARARPGLAQSLPSAEHQVFGGTPQHQPAASTFPPRSPSRPPFGMANRRAPLSAVRPIDAAILSPPHQPSSPSPRSTAVPILDAAMVAELRRQLLADQELDKLPWTCPQELDKLPWTCPQELAKAVAHSHATNRHRTTDACAVAACADSADGSAVRHGRRSVSASGGDAVDVDGGSVGDVRAQNLDPIVASTDGAGALQKKDGRKCVHGIGCSVDHSDVLELVCDWLQTCSWGQASETALAFLFRAG